jgi:hypothetical protein
MVLKKAQLGFDFFYSGQVIERGACGQAEEKKENAETHPVFDRL